MTTIASSQDRVGQRHDHAPLITYSALTKHRQCPQAWVYRYVRELDQDADLGSGFARDVGSWWHAFRAADAIERGARQGSLREYPFEIEVSEGSAPRWELAGVDESGYPLYLLDGHDEPPARLDPQRVIDAAQAWVKVLPGDEQQALIEFCGGRTLAEHLAALADRWYDRWKDDLAHELPLGVEVPWQRPLPFESGPTMGGHIDEIYLDTRRNLIIIRDHKTAKNLNSAAEDDLLDSQLHLYAWGVSPLVRVWLDRPVDAIAYDRIRSTPPKIPQVTQTGTLSKTVTDFDLATYVEWAKGPDGRGVPFPGRKKDGSGAGLYQQDPKVIEKLSTPQAHNLWTHRTRVPVNRNIVKAHVTAAIDTYREQQRTLARFKISGEAPRNLTRFGCRQCDFVDLCRAEMIGGPEGDYPLAEYGLVERPAKH